MKLTAPGWTVSDHIFGKPNPRFESFVAGLFGAFVVAVEVVFFVWVLKMIWMAV